MDAPDAALCRCGAHPGMSHGRGAGSELAFVSCGGVCSWDWLADRRHAESGAVLPPRLSSPMCGRPPRARVVGTPTQEVGQHRIGGNFSKIGEFAARYYIP
jgi:hypothetical protein